MIDNVEKYYVERASWSRLSRSGLAFESFARDKSSIGIDDSGGSSTIFESTQEQSHLEQLHQTEALQSRDSIHKDDIILLQQ